MKSATKPRTSSKRATASKSTVAELAPPLPIEFVVASLELDLLDAHPANMRAATDTRPDAVRELAQSIAAQGLLHPLTVAASGGRFTILAGHRRAAALRFLEHTHAPCRVLADGLDRAAAVQVVENEQREPLDLLGEADLVTGLLETPGWTARDVAAVLGRTQSWVERRANLRNLAPSVRADLQGEPDPIGMGPNLRTWPPTWLEELALLPHDAQLEALARCERERPESLDELREVVRGRMELLAGARWNLDDAELVPAAGACTSCPKQSAFTPALFADLAAPADVRSATCRDAACFAGKARAWLSRQAETAKAAQPAGKGALHVVVVNGDPVARAAAKASRLPVVKVHGHGDVGSAKARPGTVPALMPNGDVRHVQGPRKPAKPTVPSAAVTEKAQADKARRLRTEAVLKALGGALYAAADKLAAKLPSSPFGSLTTRAWVWYSPNELPNLDTAEWVEQLVAGPRPSLAAMVCTWGLELEDPRYRHKGNSWNKAGGAMAVKLRRSMLARKAAELVEEAEVLALRAVADHLRAVDSSESAWAEAQLVAEAFGLEWNAATVPPLAEPAPAPAKLSRKAKAKPAAKRKGKPAPAKGGRKARL